jgi:hypothetical protein
MKRRPGTFVKKLVVQVQWVQQDLQIMGRSNCANLSDENAKAVRTENKLRTIFVYNHYTKWLSNLSPGHCVEGKFNFVITWKEHVSHCMKYLSLQHFLLMNCFKPVCYVCIEKLVLTRKGATRKLKLSQQYIFQLLLNHSPSAGGLCIPELQEI